jgi:hypothetical protein
MGQAGVAGPPGPQGARGEPGPRGLPGSTGLSPELMARIARLEEFVSSARLQGTLSTIPASHVSTMTHVADLGGGTRAQSESGRGLEAGRIAEPSRASDIGHTFEGGRSSQGGRAAMETERTAEMGRTAETGRRPDSIGPEAGAGRTPVASMASSQPTDTVRTTVERSRTVANRRNTDGSSRRGDPDYGRSDDIDPVVYGATEERLTNGASYGGWLWLLPLAALAGLGLYFMLPTEQTPVTASREIVQPTRDTAAALPDLKGRTTNAIQSLTASVQGITDRATATTALPKIQDGARDMDRLAMQTVQLPRDARTELANATREPINKLNTMLDTASSLPGAGPVLQPVVARLRNRMDAIAMAPGRPLFLASAPSEWVTLSGFYDRDVLNRAGEKVGTASGFFVGPDGKITASLISVDRQLGIGDKQVALPFTSGQLVRRGDRWHLMVDASKDDLQGAKAFETTK